MSWHLGGSACEGLGIKSAIGALPSQEASRFETGDCNFGEGGIPQIVPFRWKYKSAASTGTRRLDVESGMRRSRLQNAAIIAIDLSGSDC